MDGGLKRKSWVWATGRPAVVTLLRGLYLWNRKPDWQAVFFGGYPIPSTVYVTNAESCQYPLWHVASATWGESQMFRLLFLGNGRADWVEISHALGNPLVTAYAVITGGVSLHVLMCRDTPHTALLYTRNGLTDCVQIWYVGWGSLAKYLPQVIGRVHLHVHTCAPLSHKCSACRHSVTVGPIALKFGMHLETD